MAKGKKLGEIKNPLANSGGNIFDIGLWLGGILWVIMFGMIFAMGTKALNVIDSKLPGTQTPNLEGYKNEVKAGNGITIV